MRKRAGDLSLQELSELGAAAARQAVSETLAAGLTVTGMVDVSEGGRTLPKLAELHPSGEIVLLDPPRPERAKGKVRGIG
ncbi:hypothetical protein [Rhodopseudomonas palustris]|uniref:Uncharacterized protein n=1 Tax=Rhodopseudomonas palustris TaxID=1076 RepID=A0A418VCS7_RHOPL|nr:hypothetical protein [Rhodopseudomonas palustris]RJF73954.1 hypothetical protein D4Q52_13900 [Rhodopseudomonas palustris]